MVVLNRNNLLQARTAARIALLAALCCLRAGAATPPGFDQPLAWSADVLTSDFRSDTLDLAGHVRVTQGAMLIESDTATAHDLRAERSRWSFKDSVHIRTAEADLKAAAAHAVFAQGLIVDARIEGAPAEFVQLNGRPERQVRGRAGVIEYDVAAGIVKLTKQVWFSSGKDEFQSEAVIYDIRKEQMETQGRVRGTLRPRDGRIEAAPDAKSPGRPDAGSAAASGTVAGDLESGA